MEDQILDIIDSPEYRRLNGIYLQLKAQFKEKDQTLIETRKALFLAEEQVASLNKELEEINHLGIPDEVARLQKHCALIQNEYEGEITALKEEIKALEALVK